VYPPPQLVAECREHVDWGGDGTTFATWLAWRCSLSPRQAREYERVAARLDELPRIHDAFSRGELSLAKTTAVMRIAEPETEADLLELAKATTASQMNRVENLVSLCRRHHRLVHEHGYSVEVEETGEIRFTNEYGITIPNVPRPRASSPEALVRENRRRGLVIGSDTGCTGCGDRMDIACAVDAIASIVKAGHTGGPSPPGQDARMRTVCPCPSCRRSRPSEHAWRRGSPGAGSRGSGSTIRG